MAWILYKNKKRVKIKIKIKIKNYFSCVVVLKIKTTDYLIYDC
jgi:hypothetical protein